MNSGGMFKAVCWEHGWSSPSYPTERTAEHRAKEHEDNNK